MGFSKGGWKFVGGFLGIIALALLGLAVSGYFFNPERQAARDLKNLERQYAEDAYGGTTPEETLKLFIKALEASNIELASKYFVLYEKDNGVSKLSVLTAENAKKLADDLKTARLVQKTDKVAQFEYKRNFDGGFAEIQDQEFKVEAGLVNQSVDLGRLPNGIWKIVDM